MQTLIIMHLFVFVVFCFSIIIEEPLVSILEMFQYVERFVMVVTLFFDDEMSIGKFRWKSPG